MKADYLKIKPGKTHWFCGRKTLIRRYFFYFSLLILIFLSGLWSWQKYTKATLFSVQTIKITGDFSHISKNNLKKIILPFLDKGLLGLDYARMRERLQQVAWMDDVTIQRVWPHTLMVQFTTKKPVALMPDNNLMDEQGNIFRADLVDAALLDLPLFVVPLGQQIAVLQLYRAVKPLISTLALQIKKIQLVEAQYWSLVLSNGLTLYLSRIDAKEQVKRFVRVYFDVVAHQVSRIAYVDLRYEQGIAIKLKHHVLEQET